MSDTASQIISPQSPIEIKDDSALQQLKDNNSKLNKCFQFDINSLATEMNNNGLLSGEDKETITAVSTPVSAIKKAELMLKSLELKVDIDAKNIEKMVQLLRKNAKVYIEAINILEGIQGKTSCPPTTESLSSSCESTHVSSETSISRSNASTVSQACQITMDGSLETSSDAIPVEIDTPLPKRRKVGEEFHVSLKLRNYQEELAEPGLSGENYIMIAPTGTGKTLVAARIIAEHINQNSNDPNSHVLFVVPTKVLAEQQMKLLETYIPGVSAEMCTGDSQFAIAQTSIQSHISVCTGGKFYTELCHGNLKFSQISLIVFDECHSIVRGTAYANIMKLYIEQLLMGDKKAVQIIGMTASPGAGKNPHIELRKTMEHLKMLVAHMNATGGIKTVVDNIEDLKKFRKIPKLNRFVLKPRDPSKDCFIKEVTIAMGEIETAMEEKIKLHSHKGFKKWSREYESNIRKSVNALELSDNEGFLEFVIVLHELLHYCAALSVYMKLRAEDAISVLKENDEVDIEVGTKATEIKQKYRAIRKKLTEKLETLKTDNNPLFEKLEEILINKFTENPDSRGLVFVHSRFEANAMKKWISHCSKLTDAGIRPGMITGHTSNRKYSMTQAEQEMTMEKFHDGEINLLVATSVAEQGMDIPACNLVMRYQYVVDDIRKEQAEGRARAADSECYTIVSTSSSQKYRDIRNEELILLVEDIFKRNYFPSGASMLEEIKKNQERIIDEKKKKEARQKQRRKFSGSEVKLICKDCKQLACLGSDIRTTGENEAYPHYIVQVPDFKKKYTTKRHHTPAPLSDQIYKTHKIFCSNCGASWGVEGIWSDGYQYPIIKCIYFTFLIGDRPFKVVKWSNAPFEIKRMDEVIDFESD